MKRDKNRSYRGVLTKKVDMVTDYGRTMKPFSFEIQNFWAWAGKF